MQCVTYIQNFKKYAVSGAPAKEEFTLSYRELFRAFWQVSSATMFLVVDVVFAFVLPEQHALPINCKICLSTDGFADCTTLSSRCVYILGLADTIFHVSCDVTVRFGKSPDADTVYVRDATSKAFDSLPLESVWLLTTWSFITEVEILWFKWLCSWSCNLLFEQQKTMCLTLFSSYQPLGKGVPQGSILGPLLFNLFINDIFSFVTDSSLYKYADNNTLSYSDKDVQN